MAGLEKIIADIKSEGTAEVNAVLEKARSEAAALLRSAEKHRAEESAKVREETDKQLAHSEEMLKSAIDLARRQKMLSAKQIVIDETLQKAQADIQALPNEDYFALLLKLAAKNAWKADGILYLNEKDLQRMPASFEKDIAAVLPTGAKLSLAKQARPIDGGFVLQYGDIEENCSFSAIFSARRDDFQDIVREVLF